MAYSAARIFRHGRTKRALLLVLVSAALALFGVTSQAHPPTSYGDGYGSSYGVTLEDAHGSPLRTFHQSGSTFVLGHLGERFNVRLQNRTDRRVEAVLTIDGRDAVSGGPGDYTRQRGYLIPPHGSVLVEGFRKSLSRVAAFRFSRPGDSYSSRMGTPENVGVVGVAFFPERPRWQGVSRPRPLDLDDDRRWRHRDESPSEGRAPASGARKGESSEAPPRSEPSASTRRYDRGADLGERRAAPAPGRLGTEYGESRTSRVTEVPFHRASRTVPATVLTVRYDDAAGLIARGIDVYPRPYWDEPHVDAHAFPAAFPRNRFAPPPPPYDGY